MNQKKRIFILSIDAMVGEDIEFMKTLPHLGPIVRNASYVKNVVSVYPTLTYTCHASMMTGVYPDRHHVHNNENFVPELEHSPWIYDTDVFDPDVDNLIAAAKRAGYSTASISWPVTGNIGADYLLPEVWSLSGTPETMYESFVEHGAAPAFLDEFWENYGSYLHGLASPHFHLLAHGATIAAIRNHKPEIIFEHLSMVDHARHRHGVFGNEIYTDAYFKMDLAFGGVIDALKQAGVYDDTTIIITSDHGQTPVEKLITPNLLFIRDGLVRLNEDGSLKDYDAVFRSAAHSVHVYLRDPADEALAARVSDLLKHYQETEDVGFEAIYTTKEVQEKYHLTGNFSFVIEGADGYSYSNRYTGSLVDHADNSNYKYSIATHGHAPEKGPKPAFLLYGPGVKKNVVIEQCNIVDEAPTIAALIGAELKNPDGVVLKELLED